MRSFRISILLIFVLFAIANTSGVVKAVDRMELKKGAMNYTEKLIRSDEVRITYSPLFNFLLTAQHNVVVRNLSVWRFTYMTIPSASFSAIKGLAKGGVSGAISSAGLDIMKDITYNYVKMFYEHPSAVAKTLAKHSLNLGYKKYKINYKKYKYFKENSFRISNAEGQEFIMRHYAALYMVLGKKLWNDVEEYESDSGKKYIKSSKYKSELESAIDNLDVLVNKDINTVAGIVDFYLQINAIIKESDSGLFKYPPYQNYENKLEKIYREYKTIFSSLSDSEYQFFKTVLGDDVTKTNLINEKAFAVIPLIRVIERVEGSRQTHRIVEKGLRK